ncbi:MAG: ABC transporter permease [bacterium]|nr:ABC transporter permease [bacterium]
MLASAWKIACKDTKQFWRDRTAVLLAIALPILLTTIFGSAMGSMMGDGGGAPKKVRLWVEDLDQSPASREFVASLLAADGLRVEEHSEARKGVRNGDVAAALVVPAGYADELAGGLIPKVRLLRDPSQFVAQQVISGNLLPLLAGAVLPNLGSQVMGSGLSQLGFPDAGLEQAESIMGKTWDDMSELVAELETDGAFAGAEPDSAEPADPESDADAQDSEGGGGFNFLEDVPELLGVVSEDVVGNDDPDDIPRSAGASHAVSAMAVMMLMFSIVGAGASLLEEKDGGTLQRLQLTPAAGPSILVGKLLTLSQLGLVQLVILFAYGAFLFDVPVLPHLGMLTLISVGLVVSSTGLGLLFATACTSRKQMEGLSTLVILVMSCVGGAWFPREITPDWFQTVGRFTITAYAMDAYHGVLWYGKDLMPSGDVDGIWLEVTALFVIGIVLNVLAFRFYERRFGRTA